MVIALAIELSLRLCDEFRITVDKMLLQKTTLKLPTSSKWLLDMNKEINNENKDLNSELHKNDVRRCNFSEHYGIFWEKVENLIDEEGWVYEKEAPHLLDVAFEYATDKEIDFQKSFSFLSGDNPNWRTRGARWRPKSISLFYKG